TSFPFLHFLTAQNNMKITYSQHVEYKNSESIKISNEFKQQFITSLLQKKYFDLTIFDKKSEYSENPRLNNQQGASMFQISSSKGKVYKDLENNILVYEMTIPNKA